MSLYFKLRGILYKKEDERVISDTFKKRSFVVEVTNPPSLNGYPEVKDYYSFDLINNNCSILDNFEQGEPVEVFFNIRCKEYKKEGSEGRYFTTLPVWKILKPQNNNELGQESGAKNYEDVNEKNEDNLETDEFPF